MDITTELAVVMHVVRFGYDPALNNPRDFSGLFADLCCNPGFREWILMVAAGLPGVAPGCPVDKQLQSKIHTYMGEQTPVWAKYWHILLSVILSGSYQDYIIYASNHGLYA